MTLVHRCRSVYLLKPAFLVLPLLIACRNSDLKTDRTIGIEIKRFHSVRFDPSYYYNSELKVEDLCEILARRWQENGINAVYMKVYDPLYGAVYKTNYPLNIQTDYGRLDLLAAMLKACHDQGIRVYGWIPAFFHKRVWDAHPEWRVKRADGTDYKPTPDSYLLCVRQPLFRQWWLGFIADLLEDYGDLDGVDIAEPVVTWKENEGCFCDLCSGAFGGDHPDESPQAFEMKRSEPLTTLLLESNRLIHSHGKETSLTTVVTPDEDGDLLSSEEQRVLTGLDLNAILDSPDRPHIFNGELLWQQWADIFEDTQTFTPEWTERTTNQLMRQVRDRANLVIHVEITPIGNVSVDETQFVNSIQSAFEAGAAGIDFYDSYQADQRELWAPIRRTLEYVPIKKVVVFFDPEGENDARQVEVLLRHFHTETTLIPLEDDFSSSDYTDIDHIFYLGVSERSALPRNFVRFISQTEKTVCWMNYNVQFLSAVDSLRLGFRFIESDEHSSYSIRYKDVLIPKPDSTFHRIQIDNPDVCRVVASAVSEGDDLPYAVKSGQFWYFADLPTSFVTEGGRHIVFSDLLHDILGEDHEERHLALLRIEDVNPLSDPELLKPIAKYLGSENVPFSVGVTPYYLDPATNTVVTLSERPELVKALRFMVSKGGTVLLHGYTHQYRGQTTIDYEFWDGVNDQPIFEDSEEYVKERIEKALYECFQNDLFPLIWETPHYAASLLDYSVINQYFSTSYERRQTSDILGTDQLLPFFIPKRSGKPQLIPENLGYIPYDDPSPDRMIEFARSNLAVRDGYASHFFHPFVPIDALKTLVQQIQAIGYTYGDVRMLNNHVTLSNYSIVSGESDVTVDLKDQYLNEFYLNPKGKPKINKTSDEKVTGLLKVSVSCPDNWICVTRVVDEEKPGFPRSLWINGVRRLANVSRLWEIQTLTPMNQFAVPTIIIDPEARGSLFHDQESFLNAFESVGIDLQLIPVSDFFEIPEESNLIVLPYSSALRLTEQQILFIIRALSQGMNLILEKESELSARIGITTESEEKEIQEVRDEYYPNVNIQWRKSGTYRSFDVPIEYVTYYSEKQSNDPVVIGGEYGEGKYLYFATLFDPNTAMGYGRYPYFLDIIQRQFELWPGIKRECAEIYFEPGAREDVSIEDLIKIWKKSGFRKIYVAGWHIYRNWTYDYERLIRLAHENAMPIYLWLELPHVNETIWEDHPEWREINAVGEEAAVSWRRLVALTDSSCRAAVFNELSAIIQQYNWDGINLAELYFESDLGPDRPDMFTPFHRSTRIDFNTQYGFDPITLFDPRSPNYWRRDESKWNLFQEYRKDLLVQLHKIFFAFFEQERKKKNSDIEIVATVIDDIHSKTGKWTGTDTRRLIELGKDHPFTLQIEDPGELWSYDPSRYKDISDTYRSMLQGDPLIIDINIVPYRDPKIIQAPTMQQTGMELTQLIRFALQDSNRVALYSESTLYTVDLPWISHVFGRQAKETFLQDRWEIQSDFTVSLDLDPDEHKNIRVNGNLWPAYHEGKLILSKGKHNIEPISRLKDFFRITGSTARLVDLSGDLDSCRVHRRGLEVHYHSNVPNYMIVNERPQRIMVDGNDYETDVYHGIPGFSLKLPAGSHQVTLITKSGGMFTLMNFSFFTSVFIVLVSSIAGIILIILYFRRFRSRRKQRHT